MKKPLFLSGLVMVSLPVIGWALYQHPSVNYRVEVLRAELRDTFFPVPQTLPTPIAVAPTLAGLSTLAPTQPPGPTVEPAQPAEAAAPTLAASPAPELPPQVTLTGFEHQYQKFNNCGPATLTTALSYYGRPERQDEAAAVLKPDGNDRNVSPNEMSAYIHQVGLEATVRVGGALDDLKRLIASGYPVIVEKGFDVSADKGWMGHYLLLTGYDDAQGLFIAQDSFLGPDQRVPYDKLDYYWRQFNRLYILPYPVNNEAEINSLIGPEDFTAMVAAALATAQTEAAADPNDANAWFNVGTNLAALERYAEAAAAYDQARVAGLPWRMLWYQFGPYKAYYYAGRYDEVLALADATLAAQDNLEESHYWRGLALQSLGNSEEARREFETALAYNPNFEPARAALGN